MGEYLKRYWEPDASGMNKRERIGGFYYPYMPNMLSELNFYLEESCAKAVNIAEKELAILESNSHLIDTEPLARLLLRSEAISSSRIEGLEMPASKLLEYEELKRLGVNKRLDSTEAQVIGNLNAITETIEDLAFKPITTNGICKIHRVLFEGTNKENIGGIIRTEQNWIGGNKVNPVGAAYVPPEPSVVPKLLDDLVSFANTSELPSVAIAAIAHAQFETIHPFADGNGRIGRALIHLILRRESCSRVTIPPISLILSTDHDRYANNLNLFRSDENNKIISTINEWVEYFANAFSQSCRKAKEFEGILNKIKMSWVEKTNFRKGSAGEQIIAILPGTPVISIGSAQKLINKSYPAALNAVRQLENAGILHQNAKNRKSGIYVANDILDAFNNYERSLATISGDTAIEKPRRHVPQRRK